MITIIPTILESSMDEFMSKRALLEPLVGRISLDFADNTLVPNQTVSPTELTPLSPDHQYDAHLMVSSPSQYFTSLADCGVNRVIIHLECSEDIFVLLKQANAAKLGLAITLNPETPIGDLRPYLEAVEFVQIMAIHPGFGGQPFVPETYDRIRELRQLAPRLEIAVDGSVRYASAEALLDAGANLLMVGKGGYLQNDDATLGIAKWHKLIDTYLKGTHVS